MRSMSVIASLLRLPPWRTVSLAVLLTPLLSGCGRRPGALSMAGGGASRYTPAVAEVAAGDALDRFESNWKQPTGLMPLGDPSWKGRLDALVSIARAGPDAAPALVRAMDSESPARRAFAAQALGVLAAPAGRERLRRALRDEDVCVRLNAAVALGALGRLQPDAANPKLLEEEPNWLVQAQLGFVLARDDRTDPPAAVRDALATYDLASADTAAVGRPAPDFSLEGAFGATYRLSDYRGRSTVVLVFLAQDL